MKADERDLNPGRRSKFYLFKKISFAKSFDCFQERSFITHYLIIRLRTKNFFWVMASFLLIWSELSPVYRS
jgi:hypothetical protein